MRKLIIALIGLSAFFNFAQASNGFSYGVSLGYSPTFTDYINLKAFQCASIGAPLRYSFKNHIFISTRPELSSGTISRMNVRDKIYQFNLSSVSLPLFAGYDFDKLRLLRIETYAGVKLRLNKLSHTPDGNSYVMRYNYTDEMFKRELWGLSAGLGISDKIHAPHSTFSVEYTYFSIPKKYRYSLSTLSFIYSYNF